MNRSSFYAWLAGAQIRAVRRAADEALAHEISVIHIASKHTYGAPRIHAELSRLGRRIELPRFSWSPRSCDQVVCGACARCCQYACSYSSGGT
ncbi:IS3 family transposase [Streptomyces sp. NPDC058661]|uniref:IS3 family transposase n=1 Tax=Streptomyces sp. NPDC058661 TaxID=3346582 RepID=UPI0036498E0F